MTTRQRPQNKATTLNGNRNKNWRANYLRALNIFTPDLATSTRGRHSTDGRRTQQTNRRTSTATDNRRAPVPRRSSSPSGDKSYVFGLRSHLFRARKLAPRSDLVVDHVSAPIEIPTGSVTSPTEIPRLDNVERRDSESHRRSSNDFQNSNDPKQPMVQLLSWEEPSVMLGNGWPLESEKRDRNNSRPRPYSGIAEESEDTEDEVLTTEDDDDDIFKMEFDEGSDSNARSNVFRGKRQKDRRVDLRQHRPVGFDDFDDEEDDVVTPLSASFVPPHQMVERGCFSLGLRDELKRKPGVHIQKTRNR